MNCISALGLQYLLYAIADRRRWSFLIGLIVCTACGVETSESADVAADRDYGAHYRVRIEPAESAVEVTLEIRQSGGQLRELTFPTLSNSISDFRADGKVQIGDGELHWFPPARGGTLSWRVQVIHRRGKETYDAWLESGWGMFRAEDIIPRARSRVLKGATSITTLTFDLPPAWSAITEYSSSSDTIAVERPDRRFDQPTGWMVLGHIGVRRETIAGVKVAIAGPEGHAVRRLDMLALLNWTLPELVALIPEPPERLTIVSAGSPMWRGGLSAPASLYIHADRPLISENGTSTLLHETLHTVLSIQAGTRSDWIVEGLAEYYSLELLRRGGAISRHRYARALSGQADWAKKAESLCSKKSTGATTALAVTVFRALDLEIRRKTAKAKSLDDLLMRIAATDRAIDVGTLSDFASELIGEPSDALHSDNLPGCPKIGSGNNSN